MRKALAIDLDGTLLSTNTFRDYLSYCGSAAFHNFKFGICLRIFWWVMLRKLRLVSHSRMKEVLLDSTAAFMTQKSRLDHFVEKEMTYLNTRVQRIMEPYRNRGHLLVLLPLLRLSMHILLPSFSTWIFAAVHCFPPKSSSDNGMNVLVIIRSKPCSDSCRSTRPRST